MTVQGHLIKTKATIIKFRLLKLLLICLFILPLFYDYYKFLPEPLTYLIDLVLILYLVQFPQIIKRKTPFAVIYMVFIMLILFITILSLIVHGEEVKVLVQEFRRLAYPLLFYLIFTDFFKNSQKTAIDVHKIFMFIFMVQIPITVFQILTFFKFKSLGVFAKAQLPFVDAAAGSLGAGGHVYLGVLIPLFIIYLYDLGKIKYALPFIVPIILTNSGGGLILSIGVFGVLFCHSLLAGSISYRVKSFMGIMVFVGIFLLLSTTPFFKMHINKYIDSFIYYNTAFVQGGKETWGEEYNQIKVDRFNGHKFLSRKMDNYDYENLIGLGFEFKDNNNRKPYRYKNELNFFIAERGYLGLLIYLLFILVFMFYLMRVLHIRGHSLIFIKALFFATFFIGGLYNPNTRSFQVWILFVYVLALFENRSQYEVLKGYLQTTISKTASRFNRRSLKFN